jgi:hypothetical protein
MEAVCYKCGSEKRRFDERCNVCGANPHTDIEALARSFYLSKARFLDPSEQQEHESDLHHYANQLQSHQGVVYNEEALFECRQVVQAFSQPLKTRDWIKVAWAVLYVLAPFLLGLAIVLFALWLNKD